MLQESLETGYVLDGKFEIVALAGSGGMADIYCAKHLQLERTVALKLIKDKASKRPEALKRFQQEAQFASTLKHPNITQILSFGLADGKAYIAFEFLEGKPLSDILKSEKKISYNEFISIFMQVCKGLQYAHESNVLHRDLTPGNVFLLASAEVAENYKASALGSSSTPARAAVKIMDFGIAKALGLQGEDVQKLTETGELMGTPMYMSPEQCGGEALDAQSDIYSLGCVMLKASSGIDPVEGESSLEVLYNHIYGKLNVADLPEDYPPQIAQIISKCIARDKASRYASVCDLLADLQKVVDEPQSAVITVASRPRDDKHHGPSQAKTAGNSRIAAFRWGFWVLFVVLISGISSVIFLGSARDPDSDKSGWKSLDPNTRVHILVRQMSRADNAADKEKLLEQFYTALPDLRNDHRVVTANAIIYACKLLQDMKRPEEMRKLEHELDGAWRYWPAEVWDYKENQADEDDPVVTLTKIFDLKQGRESKYGWKKIKAMRNSISTDLTMAATLRINLRAAKELVHLEHLKYDDVVGAFELYDTLAATQEPNAVKLGKRLLDRLLKARSDDLEVLKNVYSRQANLAGAEGDLSAVCSLWQQCAKIAEQQHDQAITVFYTRRVAMLKALLREKGAPSLVASWYRKVALNGLTPQVRAQEYLFIAEAYANCGMQSKAEDLRRLAVTDSRCFPNTSEPDCISGYSVQTQLAYRKARFDEARDCAAKSVNLFEHIRERYGAAQERVCRETHNIAMHLRQRCIIYQQQVVQLKSPPKEDIVRSAVETELAAICLEQAGYTLDVPKLFERAAALWLSQGLTSNCAVDELMAANWYADMHRFRDAERLLRLALSRPASRRFTLIHSLDLPAVLFNEGRYEEACALYDKALADPNWEKIAKANNEDRKTLARGRCEAGDAYFQVANWPKSKLYFLQAFNTLPPATLKEQKNYWRPYVARYVRVLQNNGQYQLSKDEETKYRELGIINAIKTGSLPQS